MEDNSFYLAPDGPEYFAGGEAGGYHWVLNAALHKSVLRIIEILQQYPERPIEAVAFGIVWADGEDDPAYPKSRTIAAGRSDDIMVTLNIIAEKVLIGT